MNGPMCQNKLCGAPMPQVNIPPMEAVNTGVMSALIIPAIFCACPKCGQQHRVLIASATASFNLSVVALERKSDSPRIELAASLPAN